LPGGSGPGTPQGGRIRLDKWLWHARIFKTRSLATRQVQAGHLRVNGAKVLKPAAVVGPGDVLTFVLGERTRVLRILAPGQRRGSAPEAQLLYDDLSPPAPDRASPEHLSSVNPAYDRGGRPTKKDRRTLDQSRLPPLE
jgi:ribosome-associated heat shock protein Hsp15